MKQVRITKVVLLIVVIVISGLSFVPTISAPPVQLISFIATQQGNGVVIDWTTASETNNDYFTVERSVDGVNYNVVAYVTGAGSTATLKTYTTTDLGVFVNLGVYYYRLKQTDFDGTYEYSDIASVQFITEINDLSVKTNPNSVMITPNPITDDGILTVQSRRNLEYRVIIFNILGYEVMSGVTRGKEFYISNIGLNLGIYFYQIQTDQGNTIRTGKVIIDQQ